MRLPKPNTSQTSLTLGSRPPSSTGCQKPARSTVAIGLSASLVTRVSSPEKVPFVPSLRVGPNSLRSNTTVTSTNPPAGITSPSSCAGSARSNGPVSVWLSTSRGSLPGLERRTVASPFMSRSATGLPSSSGTDGLSIHEKCRRSSRKAASRLCTSISAFGLPSGATEKAAVAVAVLAASSPTVSTASTAPTTMPTSAVNCPCASSVTGTAAPPLKLTEIDSMSSSSPSTRNSTAPASLWSSTTSARSPPSSAVWSSGSESGDWLTRR